MAEYTLDQFLLIFGTGEENCSAKLFNQQVNNFDIHLPWIGARRHAASWMHHNQTRAIPCRATARVAPTFHTVVRFVDLIASQQIIDMCSSISGHVQNEIKVFGGETNGSHEGKSSLDLVHHAFKVLVAGGAGGTLGAQWSGATRRNRRAIAPRCERGYGRAEPA